MRTLYPQRRDPAAMLLALSDLSAEPWRLDTACRDRADLDWFTLDPSEGEAVRAVCATCPVRDQCRAAGAAETIGVWGGLYRADQRRRAARERRRASRSRRRRRAASSG